MKLEINETKKVKERVFPKLMISDLGQIILAHGIRVKGKDKTIMGILLHSNGYEIGENYTESWHLQGFKDFNGSITLSND